MSTVLLTLPTGHNVANVLGTDVVRTMLNGGSSVRLVVLSPPGAVPNAADFKGEPIEFHALQRYRPNRLARAIDSILSEQFLRSSQLTAVKLQRDRARMLRTSPVRPILLRAKEAVAGAPVPRSLWYSLAQQVDGRGLYSQLFDQYSPDLVVTSTAGFALGEIPVIFEAERRGIPQMAIDLGWDTLSSKYHTIMPVDRLVVWNKQMRDEALRFHRFAPAQVEVAGVPQFDQYFGSMAVPSRDAFMQTIGAESGRRLITVATTAAGTYPGTAAVIGALARALSDDSLGQPAQVLVRLHPRDTLDSYEALQQLPHVFIDPQVKRLRAHGRGTDFDALATTHEDRVHLAATLVHSDVVINFASTTTIEACIFDTPVVNIGFDDVRDVPLALSIRRYFAYEHYQPVLQTGAARVAQSPADLLELVRRYLAEPSLDREGRARLVSETCEYTDGRSGVRVGQAVLRTLQRLPRAASFKHATVHAGIE